MSEDSLSQGESTFSWSIKATYADYMSLSINKTSEASPPCLYYQHRTELVCILDTESSFAISCLSANAIHFLGVQRSEIWMSISPTFLWPDFPRKGTWVLVLDISSSMVKQFLHPYRSHLQMTLKSTILSRHSILHVNQWEMYS